MNNDETFSILDAFGKQFPIYLNPRAAAEILGVSASWLAQLRSKGGGPAYRLLGRRVKYNLLDLADWMDTRPKHGNFSE